MWRWERLCEVLNSLQRKSLVSLQTNLISNTCATSNDLILLVTTHWSWPVKTPLLSPFSTCLWWRSFKYLGILLTSDGKRDQEIDKWISSPTAVLQLLYRSVVLKQELSLRAKLSVYRSIYVPILTVTMSSWKKDCTFISVNLVPEIINGLRERLILTRPVLGDSFQSFDKIIWLKI